MSLILNAIFIVIEAKVGFFGRRGVDTVIWVGWVFIKLIFYRKGGGFVV